MEKVSFMPNRPELVALKYREGKTVEGRFGDQQYYTLTDGRCMYVDMEVAAKINLLGPRVGQQFEICKYWTGRKGDKPQWDVRWADGPPPRPPAPPPTPAQATGIPETDLERNLRQSLEAHGINPNQVQPASSLPGASVPPPAPSGGPLQSQSAGPAFNNGNGNKPQTNGNGNGNGYGAALTPEQKAMLKIPMDVAFREVLTWMKAALEEHHIQWNDAAQQDFASTAVIGAMREGWIGVWRRNGHA
jgi:hypothetical protein